MNSATNTLRRSAAPAAAGSRRGGAARGLLRLLDRLQLGQLELQHPDGGRSLHGSAAAGQPQAQLRLADWDVLAEIARKGDIALAETFIAGRWHSPDPVAVLRLGLANREALERAIYGSWWGALAARLRHALNRNSRAGSRRNIHAHYDIGNAFYGLWLDETMNYSSALFEGDLARPLADAQRAKVARALAASALPRGGRLLEIGCGWGAVAEAAARDLGAEVVGVTLSTEQLDWARLRLARQGLRADLRLQDYRDIASSDGPFDAIVSIEMFEAVGEAYWDRYFATLKRLLAPGGRACVQSIVIRDELFERYRRSSDFIQQYVFPGGMLPSPAVFRARAERAGLQVVGAHAFGHDYAETLRRWREAFVARLPEVSALGLDERFQRTWLFYLAYCEAAFDEGSCDVLQFTLAHD